ncbi:MAG: F0F1 ATP synthase subunit B [Deltaproteobacteria bacterium]|nr:F0F1 ATP synthase subunit B [Deltaproteobacteria bacterium]MBW2447616.1 F0F1 ATP synthase subunit B [Deltaproteobacteria bacterium]
MRFALALAILLAPVAASASGGGDAGNEAWTLFWQGVNLIILFAVLVYYTRKPIQEFFSSRRDEVKGGLDSAASVLSDAETRLAEWQARADRLDAEVEEIKEAARQRANTESEHILADAEASAERLRNDAKTAIDQEVARARSELRAEAGELATKLAADLLQSHVTDEDQTKLVDEFVARVESSGSADGRAN